MGIDNHSEERDTESCATSSAHCQNESRKRSQRAKNVNEKKRCDKLNMYIDQLAALLPQDCVQKLDKSSVLHQSVNYLKWIYSKDFISFKHWQIKFTKCFFSTEDLGILMQELMNGCVMTLDQNWKVTFAADFARNLLEMPTDVKDQTIGSLVHCDDVNEVLNEMEKTVLIKGEDDSKKPNLRICFRPTMKKENPVGDAELSCDGYWSENSSQGMHTSHDGSDRLLNIFMWPKVKSCYKENNSRVLPVSFSAQLGMDGHFLLIDAR
eukprot:gene7574-8413_t